MLPRLPIAALLVFAHAASQAADCETLRAQIDARIRASGTSDFKLTTLDADAKAEGRVVGSCELGTKKIVYTRSRPVAPAMAASTAPRSTPMLTECKDGSVLLGGDCKK